MQIPAYQMHNVLNVYRRQLSQPKTGPKGKSNPQYPQSDRVDISNSSKRKAIMEQVTSKIIDKMNAYQPNESFKAELDQSIEENAVEKKADQPKKESPQGETIQYDIIDKNNRKITNTFSLNNSHHYLKEIDKLAQQSDKEDNGTENL